MKAVILAGGYGKRLMPLTSTVPKPMLVVGGKPIIEWQLLWLSGFGIGSFVVTCGYLKEKVMAHVNNLKKQLGIEVDYAVERTPFGTGGALKNVERFIEDDKFVAVNGDIITNIDVRKLRLGSSMAALALAPLRSTFGVARMRQGMIERFDEKPLLQGYWINAGAYLMSKNIFTYLPRRGDIERTAFKVLAERNLLRGLKFSGIYWHSIDSLKDLDETDADIRKGSLKGKR